MSDREGLEKLAELADRMDRAMETIHARELRDIRRALLAAGTEDGDTNVNPDAQPISLAEQNAGTDGPGLLEAAQEVLDSAGSSDLGKIQVTQHSLEQLHAALAARPVEAKAEAGLMEKIRDMLQNDYNFDFGIAEEVAERVLALTRPVGTHTPGLESAAWDMLHAVEAADAAGELADNIGGEVIDALRAELTPPRISEGRRALSACAPMESKSYTCTHCEKAFPRSSQGWADCMNHQQNCKGERNEAV